MSVVDQAPGDVVVVLAGDHVYKMDYSPFVAFHRQRRADVTIAVRRVPLAEATRMGILAMDESGRITEFQEKPKQPKSDLASMGVYVFSKRALHRWLDEDHPGLRQRRHPGDDRRAAPASTATASTATGRTWGRSTATGRPTWRSWRIARRSTSTTRSG